MRDYLSAIIDARFIISNYSNAASSSFELHDFVALHDQF